MNSEQERIETIDGIQQPAVRLIILCLLGRWKWGIFILNLFTMIYAYTTGTLS